MRMLYILYSIYLLCYLSIGCHADNSPVIAVDQNKEQCQEIVGEEVLFLLGHSLKITFSQAMGIKMFLLSLPGGATITCSVTDTVSNNVLNSTEFPKPEDPYIHQLNVAYEIDNVTENTPIHYKIQCGPSPNVAKDQQDCLFYNLNLTKINDAAEDCTGPAITTISGTMYQANIFILEHYVPELIKNLPGVTYHWFKEVNGECVNDFNDDVYVDKESFLNFRSVDLHDAGVYTCMAYHNDLRIILVRIITCVKYDYTPSSDLELKCNNPKVPINGNGTITCDIAVSLTKSYPDHYFWYKIGANGENKSVCNESYSIDENKVSCSTKSSIAEKKCYYSEPTEDPPVDIRTVTFNIINMQEEDFGEYRVEYRVNGIMDHRLVSNVSIDMDLTRSTTALITAIAVGVFAVVLIIGLVALCLFNKMDILWFYKRHFGPYEKDIYPYMAYFIYHYQEGQNNSESKKKTKSLVEHMHEFMNKFGGTVFDEQRDVPLDQYDANNILAVLKECHRIVLFLSADFVTDHWSRFATYSAIEAVIKEGKKIILITMPETKSSMVDIADEARRVLEMAIKRNTAIHWNGKVPFSGAFCRRLEYALPKRRQSKPDYHRYLSDSSQAQLKHYTGSPSKSLMEMKNTRYEHIYEIPSAV